MVSGEGGINNFSYFCIVAAVLSVLLPNLFFQLRWPFHTGLHADSPCTGGNLSNTALKLIAARETDATGCPRCCLFVYFVYDSASRAILLAACRQIRL
jgi:hypothetical protein